MILRTSTQNYVQGPFTHVHCTSQKINIRTVNLEPLSPSNDRHQISPNNINARSRKGLETTSGEIS